MMEVIKEFSLENVNIFDGKKINIGLESNLNRMFIGTSTG